MVTVGLYPAIRITVSLPLLQYLCADPLIARRWPGPVAKHSFRRVVATGQHQPGEHRFGVAPRLYRMQDRTEPKPSNPHPQQLPGEISGISFDRTQQIECRASLVWPPRGPSPALIALC
uniref:Putative secreted protein n=1 Tax=Anopheles darlingi TaxID=43151 RepID=A0A2M4D8V3_ANODA